MNMKTYTKPEITVTAVKNTDVITISGGIVTSKFTKSTQGYQEINF